MSHVPIALGPTPTPLLAEAVIRGGGTVGEIGSARALIWDGEPDMFPRDLPPGIEWVQLFSAGVEEWFGSGIVPRHPDVLFTSAAGAFAPSVAEHALTLLLGGIRNMPAHTRADSWRQAEFFPRMGTLRNATVAIVGAGGIGRTLIPMLAALGARSLAVNRSGAPVPGAIETLPADRIAEVWPRVDHVVIAAPATPATKHLVGAAELAALRPESWVINVARGSLIDTDALVAALRDNRIGGAGLDVTDPEPLPDGHPLWSLPNAVITPHDSNPPQLRVRAFADHVAANVARFAAGQQLLARVDPALGY